MADLLAIVWHWNVNPEIVTFGNTPFGLRYYSLLWALSFIIGFYIVKSIFEHEKRKYEDLDSLFITMLLGTILGARIGHCLFYDFQYYFVENPLKILYVWEGGLASHGAVIGILIALYMFVRKHPEYTYMWILDRIVIPIALGGAFIRTGNFFNSEIVGIPTNNNWGVVFERLGENFPRYPVQLFEAVAYYLIFFVIYRYYWKVKGKFAPGMIFGFFFVTVFGARFIIEFWKEGDKIAGLNRGHWLSVPIIIIGLFIWIRAIRNQKSISTAK